MRWKQFSVLFAFVVLLSVPFSLASFVNRVVQASAVPGNTVTVTYNVVMNQSENYYVLNDRIPAGWSVTGLGGGTVGADGVWRLTVNPAITGTKSIDLQVPQGANGAYAFSGSYGTVTGTTGFSGAITGSSSISVSGTGTVVSLTPSSQSVEVGSPFSVDLYVYGAVNVYGIQFDLTFDDAVLDLQSVVGDSELLGQNIGSGNVVDSNALGNNFYQPGSGLINDFVILRSGVSSGVTSSGKVATLTFTTPGQSGNVGLILSNVRLVDPQGGSLVFTTQNAAVEVGYCGDSVTQTGLGETCDDGDNDDGDGCSSDCNAASCAARGGDSCIGGEVCTGSAVPSADSATCCNLACAPPAWNTCAECGTGLFNACDQNECEVLISESCFFTDTGFPGDGYGSCGSCSGASSCSNYGAFQSTCEADVCGLAPPTCVFNVGTCVAASTEVNCIDGIDNDNDGSVDCLDNQCAGQIGPNGLICCGVVGDCTNDDCKIESCVSNECIAVDRPQGAYTECGECQACDAVGGNCAVVGLADEGALCSGECTYCVAGVCTDRAAHDFDECTSECEACTGLPGSICESDTHTEGSQCLDPGKYCSAGNCCNDANGNGECDSCTINEECDSPYSCAVGVCQTGSCSIDLSGCNCANADTNQDGQWNVNDLVFIVTNPSNPRADVDGVPGVDIGDLVYVATRLGICSP